MQDLTGFLQPIPKANLDLYKRSKPCGEPPKIILAILVGLMGLLGAGILLGCGLLTLLAPQSAQANDPTGVAADLPKPDRGYDYGHGIAGEIVFVWDCYENKHIVIHHFAGEFFSEPYKREEAACGELTPIETSLAGRSKRELDPGEYWKSGR